MRVGRTLDLNGDQSFGTIQDEINLQSIFCSPEINLIAATFFLPSRKTPADVSQLADPQVMQMQYAGDILGSTSQSIKFGFKYFINLLRKSHAHTFTKQAAKGSDIRCADGRVKINAG